MISLKVFVHDVWERNKSEWSTIYINRLFVFFRTTLKHFEGDKKELIELYNKTSIADQAEIPGPEKCLFNVSQQKYL